MHFILLKIRQYIRFRRVPQTSGSWLRDSSVSVEPAAQPHVTVRPHHAQDPHAGREKIQTLAVLIIVMLVTLK